MVILVDEGKKWVKLAALGGELEAELLMGLLQTNEIPAQKIYPGISQAIKIYMGTAMGVEVHVPQKDLARAQELLKEMEIEC